PRERVRAFNTTGSAICKKPVVHPPRQCDTLVVTTKLEFLTALPLIVLLAVVIGGSGGCASPSARKVAQVETAQNQMFGPYSSRRLQRRKNVEGRQVKRH
ncbi:MAG: hypothetical protein WA771_10615, partial [Chthoniobacterales bacterium]